MAGNPPSNKQLAAQIGHFTTLAANLGTAVNNLATAGADDQAPTGTALAHTLGLAAGNNLINFNTKNGLVLY